MFERPGAYTVGHLPFCFTLARYNSALLRLLWPPMSFVEFVEAASHFSDLGMILTQIRAAHRQSLAKMALGRRVTFLLTVQQGQSNVTIGYVGVRVALRLSAKRGARRKRESAASYRLRAFRVYAQL